MKKKEFLDLLKYYLDPMPKNVIADILDDYEEHFEAGFENRKTEDEICRELGSPEQIANDYMNNEKGKFDTTYETYNYKTKGKNKENKPLKFLIILLAVLGAITILGPGLLFLGGLVITIIALVFSVFIVGLSLAIVGLAIPIIFVPDVFAGHLISMPNFVYTMSPITRIFSVISFILFSILLMGLSIKFLKFLIRMTKKLFIAIKWELKKRRII